MCLYSLNPLNPQASTIMSSRHSFTDVFGVQSAFGIEEVSDLKTWIFLACFQKKRKENLTRAPNVAWGAFFHTYGRLWTPLDARGCGTHPLDPHHQGLPIVTSGGSDPPRLHRRFIPRRSHGETSAFLVVLMSHGFEPQTRRAEAEETTRG